SCATPILPSGPLGHVPEMTGHVAEIPGHDPETAGHVHPKYAINTRASRSVLRAAFTVTELTVNGVGRSNTSGIAAFSSACAILATAVSVCAIANGNCCFSSCDSDFVSAFRSAETLIAKSMD
ncbi:hypothetical protein, partial [Paraburkholderia sp. EG304]|uniref:hypothetical protein n=1 Tax=Paraburkholderia sp. EG304 TaxID=3237015 RepID=UPI00397A6836